MMGVDQDLMWLTYTGVITLLMWVPYTLNMMMKHGVVATVGNRDKALPLAMWAERAKRAHYNAVENLVVFAALVLVAHIANKHGNVVTQAAMVYFWARLVHYVLYAVGVPWARTIIWTVGWVCTLVIAVQILS